jgi:hypothetical protein
MRIFPRAGGTPALPARMARPARESLPISASSRARRLLPRSGFAQRFGPGARPPVVSPAACPIPRVPYEPPARYKARLELPAEPMASGHPVPAAASPRQNGGTLRGRGMTCRASSSNTGRRSARLALAFPPERGRTHPVHRARLWATRSCPRPPSRCASSRAAAVLRLARQAGFSGREAVAARLIERLSARLGNPRVFGIALADDRPGAGWRSSTRRPDRRGTAAHAMAAQPAAAPRGVRPASLQGMDLVTGPSASKRAGGTASP